MIISSILFNTVRDVLSLLNCVLMVKTFFQRVILFRSRQFALLLAVTSIVSMLKILLRSSGDVGGFISYTVLDAVQNALLLALALGMVKRKANIVIYILIYEVVLSILTQTTIYLLHVTVQMDVASSAVVIDVVNCFWAAVFLNVFTRMSHSNLFKNTPTVISELPTIFSFAFLVALFLLGLLEASQYDHYTSQGVVQTIAIVIVFLLVMLLFCMTLLNRAKLQSESMVTLLGRQMEDQVKHFMALRKYEEEVRAFRHDFTNMVFCLRVILETQGTKPALAYLDKMLKEVMPTDQRFDTGNLVADSIFAAKAYMAKDKNIRFVVEGPIPTEGIEAMDLGLLLSNAIDNAVEACENLKGEKLIQILAAFREETWMLNIVNPIGKPVEVKKGTLVSTKSDRQAHGYGMQNMRRVVRKYDGAMGFLVKDGRFILQIRMEMRQKA